MKNPHDPRHQRRQRLVEELFKGDFHTQKLLPQAQEILQNKDFLDKTIGKAAPEFPVEKINKVDLAILRLAIWEMLIEKSTPPKVVVDEAIELSKEYGGDTSASFVNGVLGNIIKQ